MKSSYFPRFAPTKLMRRRARNASSSSRRSLTAVRNGTASNIVSTLPVSVTLKWLASSRRSPSRVTVKSAASNPLVITEYLLDGMAGYFARNCSRVFSVVTMM